MSAAAVVIRDPTATDDPPVRIAGPPLRNLPKHARYNTVYRRLDYFWGLGVEHETYVATSQTRTVRAFDAATLKPERYSVSYYKAYQPAALQAALTEVLADASAGLVVPVLMNNHSFTDADVFGEHRTTYEKIPKLNPRYEGRSFYDWASLYSAWLRDERDRTFTWDGDTVEFMTQRFYNARVSDVLEELAAGEDRFVAELGTLPKRGILCAYTPLRLAAPRNEPFATYLTHPRGVAMFNNGTLHVNVTLPTRLGWNRQPLWWDDFVDKHRRMARLVQWLEPLWIACYGSGDPFAALTTNGHRFAAGSQRLAVSRYIGVGMFDTDTMPQGKILQVPRPPAGAIPWYDWLYARTAYAPLNVIGLDINFYKHGAHGLELRIFDQMSRESLREVLEQIVVLMDVALTRRAVPDPRRHPEWQTAAGEALYYGAGWRVTPEQIEALTSTLGVDIAGAKEPMTPRAVLTALMEAVKPQRGWCWQRMVAKEADHSSRGQADGRAMQPSGCSCLP